MPATGKDALDALAFQLRSSIRSFKAGCQLARSPSREHVWLLCWLVKDMGWILLCGPIAWLGAVVGLTVQVNDALNRWGSASVGEWAHCLAAISWLLGSSTWMTAQLLFEPNIHKFRASPWYSGAIFSPNADAYNFGSFVMQAIHIATLVGLSIFYVASARADWLSQFTFAQTGVSGLSPTGELLKQRKVTQSEKPSEALIFGVLKPEVYSKIFIVPWILKDLFWCNEHFVLSMICMLLVTVLMADYLCLFMKWKNLAALLWTTGSAVWISNDLIMRESEMWPLLLSILFFAVGICVLSAVLITGVRDSDTRRTVLKEADPLL
jgi:hypothetical protein